LLTSRLSLSDPGRLSSAGVFRVSASVRAEWLWVIGRFFLAGLAMAGLISFIDDGGAFTYLATVTVLGTLVNIGLTVGLLNGHIKRVFLAGLALDLIIVLAVWSGATWILADSGRLNDVHLATLPIIAASAVRLGWPLGVAQSFIFAAWLIGANLILLDPGTYVASQTPLRALLIIITAALTLWMVARIRVERERSESLWLESEILADLSRVLGSVSDFDAIYGRFSNSIRNLIPFDRMSLLTVDGERGSMSLRYIDGAEEFASTDDRIYEIKLASFAADTGRPVRVSRGMTSAGKSATGDPGSGVFDSSIAAPIHHEGRAIGVLSLHAKDVDSYGAEQERIIDRIADQISGILARDIAHAHEVEFVERHAALEMENEELEKLSHERAEFAAAVAHEFKTPLATMMAFTEVLKAQRDGELTATQRSHLSTIQRSGKNLLSLLDDLLAITRFSAGVMTVESKRFDFHVLWEEVVANFADELANRNQKLATEISDGPIHVVADRFRIAQVLSNLLNNASNYSADDSHITFHVTTESDRIGLSIKDEGIGIPYEDQRDLFEPFYRVDNEITRSVSGSGLGLAMTRAIVEQHGGEISLESIPGVETTFWVSLPILSQDQSGVSQDRAA